MLKRYVGKLTYGDYIFGGINSIVKYLFTYSIENFESTNFCLQ